MKRAYVIGSGPNGLAAAIALAQKGLAVEVQEAAAEPGGACRSLPLTLPGFVHDFGSAVHPLAAGSPFFNSLSLGRYGLEWIHGDAPLAHPLDNGTAVLLERDRAAAERELGEDGRAWGRLVGPVAAHWNEFAEDGLRPLLHIPKHPLLMAQFGISAMQPAATLAHGLFKGERARALFAGIAAHSFLSFDAPMSSAAGVMLGAAAHAVGWPIPRGGSSAITNALVAHLKELGGEVHTSRRVNAAEFEQLQRDALLTLCDTAPRILSSIAGARLKPSYKRKLQRFEHAPGAFKVDYALSQPVPWRAAECLRAVTVHLGGTFEEIAAAEGMVVRGQHPERPFVLIAQPTIFDHSRAPQGRHVLWAYCHVPNGSQVDMTERIEAQIERFAPGFRDCILARNVSSPARLEEMDANLVGGDISGGAYTVRQFLMRPTLSGYATGTRSIYLCSSSTPPGGGVHGMCGYHAARLALRELKSR